MTGLCFRVKWTPAKFLVVAAGLSFVPIPVSADICTWDATTGDWNDGSRWDCSHEPGAGDTAVIDGGAVNLTAAATVDSLEFGSGTLQGGGDLQVSVSMTWTGGTLGGTGKSTIPQGASLAISGTGIRWLNRAMDNAGTATWSGIRDINGSGAFTNLSTGTFTIQNDESFKGGSGAQFINDGMVIKTGGAGETEFDRVFTQSSSGTLDVQTGTIRFDFDSNLDGSVNAVGTTIRFQGGTSTVASTALLMITNLNFTGGSVSIELGGASFTVTNLSVSGGVQSLTGPSVTIPNLTLSAGTLQGTADVEVTSQFNWMGGNLGGTGKATIPQGASLAISGTGIRSLDRAMDNAGTATWSGIRDINGSGAFTNLSTGTFTIQNDESFKGSSGAQFINDGMVIKTGGAGETEIDRVFTQSSSGTLDVQTGTIRFDFDSNLDGSVKAVGTAIRFQGGVPTFDDGVDFDVTNLRVGGGLVNMSNISDLTLENVDQSGGTLTLDHPGVLIEGDFVRSSGTFIAGKGRLIFGSGGEQNLTLSDPTDFFLLEVSSGTTLIEANATDHATINGFLRNRGTIRKTQTIPVNGTISFGLTDIELNIVDAGSLTSVQVDRIYSDHPSSADPTMPDFYWQLTPTGGGATVDLTLYHCYQSDSEALLCRWTGGSWDCGNDFSTQMSITRQGVTEFGDWSAGAVDPLTFMTAFECGNVSAWSDVRGLC